VTVEQIATMVMVWGLVGAIFVVPIGLTYLATARPLLLTPFRKLGVSTFLIVVAFALPLAIPRSLDFLQPISAAIGVPILAAVTLPQGFLGVVPALFLVLKSDRPSRGLNTAWWCVTLLPAIWSVYFVLALGEMDNWW